MAWRIDETGDIVIDGWEKGIADNPYNGINTLTQVNIATIPGEVSVGFPATSSTTSGGTLGKPIARATGFTSGAAATGNADAYYILDASSQVWKSTSLTGTWSFLSTSNTTTGADATNQGLAYWKNYLFKFRNNSIDYLASGAGTWVSGWNTATGGSGTTSITGAVGHFAFVGRDDVLYFCNGPFVGSIQEVAGQTFDPTNTATFTFNTQALAIPSFDSAVSLEEQGFNLLIGGTQNAIYVWDRISPTFNNRIFIAENYIRRMVKSNTNVYIFPGNVTGRGKIFVTNGSQADLVFKIPDFITNREEPYYVWGDVIYHRNNLVFSFQPMTNNSSPASLTQYGVWALDLETNAFRQLTNFTGYANVLIADQSNFATAGMSYMIGVYDASNNYSIQNSSTAAGTGSATIITDQIPVGTVLKKTTFKQVEFKLGTDLASSESVVLTAISDLDNSTALGTFNTVGTFSGVASVAFEASQWLQIQAVITGASVTGVRLREIRIR